MSVIKIKCINQELYFENTPVIASGDKGVDFVEFSFCSKWDGYSRVAIFWRNEDEPYAVHLNEDGTAEIPKEVMTQQGVIYIGAFGVNDQGQRRTTQVLSYRIDKGAWTAGAISPDPSPDVYDQLLALYTEMGEKYTDLTEAMPFKADLVDGKVPASQLPAFVDDVLEFASRAAFPATGESGKIYVATDKNLTYRWSGSTYVEVSPSLALGETASTAYRGDRGAAAYAHSQVTGANPHGTTAEQVGAVPNTRTVNGVQLNKDIRLPIIVASEEEPDDVQDGDVWLDLNDEGADVDADLPVVTTDDNGSTLRVVEGAWTVVPGAASTVDLSRFESDGVITETYPDGPTVTYTVYFDTNGNPIKITDSYGNVTMLTW